MKNIVKIILISALGGALSLGAYKMFFEEPEVRIIESQQPGTAFRTSMATAAPEDFTEAAEKTVNAVVHVTTAVETRGMARSPLEFFFGSPQGMQPQPRVQMGSGSGVILSEDGYIVTNNHVIDNAQKIEVVLNNGEEYSAEVVGADPNTDIALIKVNAKGLPYLTFSNSDDIRLGEWVLAVGNPFNLTSTVTAGIVSAKSRSIGIIAEQTAIESFIQTDAAVNPGNSGGALVNTRGELVGINSAISSRTGSYEGYSFAVPSNIVKKVVEDLLEFGTVQRAFMGVNISDVNPRMVAELDLDVNNGVYIGGVSPNGAAADAGIRKGDIIVAVNDRPITKSSELQELIGRKRPGDKVSVTVLRDGDQKRYSMELRNITGTTGVVKRDMSIYAAQLAQEFESISDRTKQKFGIDSGLRVKKLGNGILAQNGIPEDFIITHINRREVSSPKDIDRAVEGLTAGDPVVVQGYLPNGKSKYYVFGY